MSTDPRAQALIDPAYLSDREDLETMVDGVLKAQQIARQEQLVAWGNAPSMMIGYRAADFLLHTLHAQRSGDGPVSDNHPPPSGARP